MVAERKLYFNLFLQATGFGGVSLYGAWISRLSLKRLFGLQFAFRAEALRPQMPLAAASTFSPVEPLPAKGPVDTNDITLATHHHQLEASLSVFTNSPLLPGQGQTRWFTDLTQPVGHTFASPDLYDLT